MSCAPLETVHNRLAILGRPEVRVIAVSKTHGPERIRELMDCGQRDFGENRQNEAREKFPLVPIEDVPAGSHPIFHHIGPLQSGSARQIPQLFHWVHGVSSLKALSVLHSSAAKQAQGDVAGRPLQYLIQVRLTNEASKAGGITPEELPVLLESRPTGTALSWVGFMTMGPESGEPRQAAAAFRALRVLRDKWLPDGELSMGMSGDWEIAVAEGATMIRLGTILFGAREGGPWTAGKPAQGFF